MYKSKNQSDLNRRDALKMFGMASSVGLLGMWGGPTKAAEAREEEKAKNNKKASIQN